MKKILIGLSFFLFFICTTAFSKVSKDVINSKAIYLDAGHGGMDGGTSYNGILEKDVDLDFVFTLKEVLENNGYIVYLTREGDYDLASANSKNRKREDIQKRVDLINSSNCFLYLSIHANSYSNNKISGAQVFYNSNNIDNKNLATYIQKSIRSELKNTKREAMPIKDKYLVDNINKVGCLIEIGFLSNPNEASLLTSKSYQLALSGAILLGILEYEELIK